MSARDWDTPAELNEDSRRLRTSPTDPHAALLYDLGMFREGMCGGCGARMGDHRRCRLCDDFICLCQHNGRVCKKHGKDADHPAEDCDG